MSTLMLIDTYSLTQRDLTTKMAADRARVNLRMGRFIADIQGDGISLEEGAETVLIIV